MISDSLLLSVSSKDFQCEHGQPGKYRWFNAKKTYVRFSLFSFPFYLVIRIFVICFMFVLLEMIKQLTNRFYVHFLQYLKRVHQEKCTVLIRNQMIVKAKLSIARWKVQQRL